MEKLLISACLLGRCCKYDGGNNALPEESLSRLRDRYQLVPVCPEADGGLPTPRVPSECRDGRVFSLTGEDLTAAFRKGAEIALSLAREHDCRKALLKERSPSCGPDRIYDGSFQGRLIPGDGVAARLLRADGLLLFGESQISSLL